MGWESIPCKDCYSILYRPAKAIKVYLYWHQPMLQLVRVIIPKQVRRWVVSCHRLQCVSRLTYRLRGNDIPLIDRRPIEAWIGMGQIPETLSAGTQKNRDV